MAKDNTTYGFNRADATDLVGLIGSREKTYVEGKTRGGGSGGGREYFFELLEDMPPGHDQWCYANLVDWTKTVVFEAVQLYNWGDFLSPTGIIDGATSGYGGIARQILGRWAFWQGECIVPCVGEGAFAFSLSPDSGTVGQTDYAWTPGTTGTIPGSGAYGQTGLPVNWAIDADTGEITGPDAGAGGIAAAGDIPVVITCTTPNTDTGVGGNCVSTRRIVITVNAA